MRRRLATQVEGSGKANLKLPLSPVASTSLTMRYVVTPQSLAVTLTVTLHEGGFAHVALTRG